MSKPHALLPVFNGQLLAAHGYAVIYPSLPLGPGASTDVMATPGDECAAAIDALAAKGIVDPKRVGVIGPSFGGYSTAAVLAARSDRFRAGVAMAGIYDWSFSYAVPSMSEMLTNDGRNAIMETKMVEDGQIRLGAPPWVSPEAYMRNSPLFHVQDINSPLLFLHGDLDMALTGLPNALRMYNAMVRAGKHPALVRYWGEGHVASSAWAMRDQMQRIFAWFDALVKGDEPPAAKAAAGNGS